MYIVNSYFTVAIYLAVIMGIVIVILHWHNLIAADSRLKRMMISCGIDEKTIADSNHLLKIDLDAVRARCRNCPVTNQCDSWLAGESGTSNGFCPNAWHFAKVAGSSRAYNSMSAWITG